MSAEQASHRAPPARRAEPWVLLGLVLLVPALAPWSLALAWGVALGVAGWLGWGASRGGKPPGTPVAAVASASAALASGPTSVPTLGGVDSLCEQVLPLWAGQVAMARGQTEEAVTALAQRFAGIVAALSGALPQDRAEGMAREAQAHQTLQQVQQLIARLEHRAGEQSRFEVQLEQLQTLVAGVRRLTPELISIARQTHQLALGTALEAARAGEGGRVFAQMAEDVQRVAAVSDSLAVDVSGLLGGLSALGAEALADSRRYEQEDLALARALAGLLPEHLATLDALAGAQGAQLQQLISQDLALVDEVDAALVALQFQDRVSQVLVAVEQDMQRLEREVKLGRAQLLAGERAEPIDAEAWMARLSQGFTTPEQHSLRRGAAPGPAQDDVGITFF